MYNWGTISISEKLYKDVEVLVEKGYYLCVSEFVSEAIENLLKYIWAKRKCLLYTRKHVWVEDNSKEAKIGLSEYAAGKFKTIILVRLVEAGEVINEGEPLAVLETTSKRLFIVYSPVTCRVKQVNDKVLEEPYLINEDPYDAGWIVLVEPLNFEVERKHLLVWEDYDKCVNAPQTSPPAK